mmetsp:Transcript_6069/g.11483  ORF Transcript_6069/g.11483 Transcript_6069/m.11483 type:complete len:289 (+) Transcript_6069:677-1543(+)
MARKISSIASFMYTSQQRGPSTKALRCLRAWNVPQSAIRRQRRSKGGARRRPFTIVMKCQAWVRPRLNQIIRMALPHFHSRSLLLPLPRIQCSQRRMLTARPSSLLLRRRASPITSIPSSLPMMPAGPSASAWPTLFRTTYVRSILLVRHINMQSAILPVYTNEARCPIIRGPIPCRSPGPPPSLAILINSSISIRCRSHNTTLFLLRAEVIYLIWIHHPGPSLHLLLRMDSQRQKAETLMTRPHRTISNPSPRTSIPSMIPSGKQLERLMNKIRDISSTFFVAGRRK